MRFAIFCGIKRKGWKLEINMDEVYIYRYSNDSFTLWKTDSDTDSDSYPIPVVDS